MMPRDVIADEMAIAAVPDPYDAADKIIEALGEAGFEIVQRFTDATPWLLYQPGSFEVARGGEQVVMTT
jgi:hypothetical protein